MHDACTAVRGLTLRGEDVESANIRVLIVVVIGAVGGLISALITRLIFGLGVGGLSGAWFGLFLSAVAGMLVLFIVTQLMAQSPPQYSKRTVFTVVGIASAVLGLIAAAGLLLVIRLTGSSFFQGRGFVHAVLSVLASGAMASVCFFVAAPFRGFDHDREPSGEAPERFQVKIKSKMLGRLSRSDK